jgi:hypothetical protein
MCVNGTAKGMACFAQPGQCTTPPQSGCRNDADCPADRFCDHGNGDVCN